MADSISTDGQSGFGRILFTLDPVAHVAPTISGSVLTLTFDRKISVTPNAIAQGLPTYLAGGRADPNGLVYRFALVQNVRVHTSASTDRIAIDLVPDNFAGTPPDLPPPPPKEASAVEVSKLPPLEIHAGAYSSYSRIVFDWPKKVTYAVFPGTGHVTIRFEAMARPDFAGFENVSPPWVKEAGWRVENRGTVIEFDTDPQSTYHDSRDGTKVVLDISAPTSDAAAYAANNSGKVTPASANQTGSSTIANAQAKAISEVAKQLNGVPPATAVAAPATNATQTLPKPSQPPAQTAAQNTTDSSTPQALRTHQGVVINFPEASSAPVAAFIRGMTAWIVIDRAEKIDPQKLKTVLGDFPASLDEATGNGVTTIRVGLKSPEEISVQAAGSNLHVEIAPHTDDPPMAIGFVRDDSDPKHTTLTTLIPTAAHAITEGDPAAGDTLIVVPGVIGRGVLDARHYAEFAILPTAAGLVVQPFADDLAVSVTGGHVTIARPSGLTMTAAPAVSALTPAGLVRGDDSSAFLDFANWSSTQGMTFADAEHRLMAHIAAQGSQDANHARLALARFYLGNQFAAEALGMINLIEANDPSLQSDLQIEMMRAAADYMMGRYRDAHNDIGSGALDNDRHAAFWRGMIETQLQNWDGARKAFAMAEPVFHRYTPEWQARARLAEAEAGLATNAIETADAALERLPRNLPRKLALEAQLDRARLDASEGHSREAHALFAALEDGGDEQIAANAIFDDTEAGLNDGAITRAGAISALEHLRFRWRGDSLELKTLRKLGALYFEEKRWREGLLTLRVASQNFPNDDIARHAQDDMRATFVNLFLKGGADRMSPIQALGLFYDFIDLTPIGPDGDEMIRRMADRLVAVDLLGPAETLLNYQVTKRLDGMARAQVAMRLAMIDLMDHKPKDALATLRATEMAGLPDDLNHGRIILEARALAALKQWDQALDLIAVDEAPDTRRLRADIYWESGNWAVAGPKAEEAVGDRWSDATPLTADERQEIMRAAIAYSLADDEQGLDRLRQHFAAKMASSRDASAFAVVTQNIDLQGVAFRDLAGKIASVDTLETFMQDFKQRLDAAKQTN